MISLAVVNRILVSRKDKGNIANARVAGLQKQIGMTDYQVRLFTHGHCLAPNL